MSLPLLVGYKAAHHRIEAARGKASEYLCVRCLRQAQHWAYMHICPDELIEDGHPYSPHPGYYQPMCVACHLHMDREIAAIRAEIASYAC